MLFKFQKICIFISVICKLIFNWYSLETESNKKILFLTDIHLNHIFDSNSEQKTKCLNSQNIFKFILNETDFGKYGCNSNINLLDSLLDNIKNENKEKFDLIIIGGDSLMHFDQILYDALIKFGSNFSTEAKKIFDIIKNKIREKLNNENILYVLGNNDFFEKYDTADKNSFEEQATRIKDIFMNKFYLKNKSKFKDLTIETN